MGELYWQALKELILNRFFGYASFDGEAVVRACLEGQWELCEEPLEEICQN